MPQRVLSVHRQKLAVASRLPVHTSLSLRECLTLKNKLQGVSAMPLRRRGPRGPFVSLKIGNRVYEFIMSRRPTRAQTTSTTILSVSKSERNVPNERLLPSGASFLGIALCRETTLQLILCSRSRYSSDQRRRVYTLSVELCLKINRRYPTTRG